jgi:hypothetical protein
LLFYSASCLMVAFSVYSLALKMEEICYSDTSVNHQQTTRRYIPKESAVQIITLMYVNGPVTLWECETWSVILRKIKEDEGVWEQNAEENVWTCEEVIAEVWENCTIRTFISCRWE